MMCISNGQLEEYMAKKNLTPATERQAAVLRHSLLEDTVYK